jgi:hypothetical protein
MKIPLRNELLPGALLRNLHQGSDINHARPYRVKLTAKTQSLIVFVDKQLCVLCISAANIDT